MAEVVLAQPRDPDIRTGLSTIDGRGRVWVVWVVWVVWATVSNFDVYTSAK